MGSAASVHPLAPATTEACPRCGGYGAREYEANCWLCDGIGISDNHRCGAYNEATSSVRIKVCEE